MPYKLNPATGQVEEIDPFTRQFLSPPSNTGGNVAAPIIAPPPNLAITPPLANPTTKPYASTQPTSSAAFSPFDADNFPRTGSYGESVAFGSTDYLKKLRAALDAGQISVADFLKLGQPAAETAFKEIGAVAGRGSKAADLANPLIGQLQQYGFIQSSDGSIRPKLPTQYQQEAYKGALPSGITPEEQQQFLSQLPPGIDPFSDQGKLEIEKLREQAQASQAQKKQQELRNTAIGGLQDVIGQQSQIRNQGISALQQSLDQEANRQFSLDQPGIFEDLNARGLLHSSALGDALARQKSLYAGDVANRIGQAQLANTQQGAADLDKLSAARLASTDQDVSAIQQALLNSNQLQQGGITRQFGLSDFATQANLARQIAAASMPQGGGGGGGIAGAFSGALGGAGIGAQVGGGPGALIGGALGAGGGYAAGRSQAGGGTYLCTHLRRLGLATDDEIDQVHAKVFGVFSAHLLDFFLYSVFAPAFILQADDFDWERLKPRIIDDIIATESNEEAFQKYRAVCLEIMPETRSLVEA